MKHFDVHIHTLNDYINDCDTTNVTVNGKEMTFTNDINTANHDEIIKSVLNKLGISNATTNMYWDRGGYNLDWYESCYEVYC